jgi:hypothetical protein
MVSGGPQTILKALGTSSSFPPITTRDPSSKRAISWGRDELTLPILFTIMSKANTLLHCGPVPGMTQRDKGLLFACRVIENERPATYRQYC